MSGHDMHQSGESSVLANIQSSSEDDLVRDNSMDYTSDPSTYTPKVVRNIIKMKQVLDRLISIKCVIEINHRDLFQGIKRVKIKIKVKVVSLTKNCFKKLLKYTAINNNA